jgi:outer membrane usher protein FimD/PapC
VRAQLDYAPRPLPRLRDATLSADGRFDAGTLSLNLTRTLDGTDRTAATAGWSHRFSAFNLGCQVTWTDDGSFTAGVNVDFGLGREPESGSWRAGSQVGASRCTASARVFLDRNANDALDASDTPVERAAFLVNRAVQEQVRTDHDGRALLSNLPPHRLAEVSLDEGSLEDPYWMPLTQGVRVLARPGAPARLVFLVQETGEIDGTVFLKRGEDVRKASGVRLQLLDREGRVAQDRTSGFDGFYLFDRVPLGSYSLRMAPGEAGRLSIAVPLPRSATLSPERVVASAVDWMLEEASP